MVAWANEIEILNRCFTIVNTADKCNITKTPLLFPHKKFKELLNLCVFMYGAV